MRVKTAAIAILVSIATAGVSREACATIVVTVGPESGNSETHIFLDALDPTKTVTGHVGSQTGALEVTFTSTSNVDAKNGFASIDAIGNGNAVYNDLTVTGPSGYHFTDLVFDTQKASHVSITAFDGSTIVGTYSNDSLKNGLDEFLVTASGGSVFTSLEITSSDGFSEIKHFQISGLAPTLPGGVGGGAPAAPEPTTWAMMIIGFLGLGWLSYRRGTRGTLSVA